MGLRTRAQTPGLSGSWEPAAKWALSAAVALQDKCLTSDPWQSCLPSFGSGCGVPPSAGWPPSPCGSRICQGVVPIRSRSRHLLLITPWQSAGRCPRGGSVNHCSERREGSRGLERKQRFGRGFDWVTAGLASAALSGWQLSTLRSGNVTVRLKGALLAG